MNNHLSLQCSVCGYIPDDDDLDKTDYKLGVCDTCGHENICDLCLFYSLSSSSQITNIDINMDKTKCPECSPVYRENGEKVLFGKDRKLWLEDEYYNSIQNPKLNA